MNKNTPFKTTLGFTLIEVLVALGIVAVVSLLCWRGLSEVLRGANRISEVDARTQTTQATFEQLERDLKALNLGASNPQGPADEVSLTSNGLLIRGVSRTPHTLPARVLIRWELTDQGLLRTEQREGENTPPATALLPFEGMQLRLLWESGGWSAPVTLGHYSALNWQDVDVQGTPLNRPTSGGSQNTERIRAVEIGLTQSNHQTIQRLLLTGGMY
jgi:prepilin-type N-terminal cleavage/methylation domain-containing protein